MECAMIRIEDLQIEINGLGLVPAAFLVPELLNLDIERLSIQADYVYETIKNLQVDELGETKEMSELLKQMRFIDVKKFAVLASKNLPAKLMVMKTNVKDDLFEVYEWFSERTMYANSRDFNNNRLSDAEQTAYLQNISLANINGIDEIFRAKKKQSR